MIQRVLLFPFVAMMFLVAGRQAAWSAVQTPESQPVVVGWIGALTGPMAKYGSGPAAQLAVEDVNAAGGINGRPLKLVMEDGQCNGKAAVSAFSKLADADRVRYILGGHCTPETASFAPLAEKRKIVTLAAITSSAKVSGMGRYIFRVSAVNSAGGELVGDYAFRRAGVKRLGIVREDTDYVLPESDAAKAAFEKAGGTVVALETIEPGHTDYRSVLTKLRGLGIDGLYMGTQSADSAVLIIRQARELGMRVPVFGNAPLGNAVNAAGGAEAAPLLEGAVFADPEYNESRPETRRFIEAYRAHNQGAMPPYGVWTAEAYDSVRLLADTIARCGDDPEKVRDCLEQVRDYHGASANFGMNHLHDATRRYMLRVIHQGKIDLLP